jgi:predicted TIM-barrel fold metal-dependent hydrolase
VSLRLPLLMHVGVPLPSMLMKYSHPFLLDELALRHPDLTIIAAHAGAPWVLETLAVAVRHPNVYLDVSALPAIRRELLPVVLALCAEQGLEDRVLFGGDFLAATSRWWTLDDMPAACAGSRSLDWRAGWGGYQQCRRRSNARFWGRMPRAFWRSERERAFEG